MKKKNMPLGEEAILKEKHSIRNFILKDKIKFIKSQICICCSIEKNRACFLTLNKVLKEIDTVCKSCRKSVSKIEAKNSNLFTASINFNEVTKLENRPNIFYETLIKESIQKDNFNSILEFVLNKKVRIAEANCKQRNKVLEKKYKQAASNHKEHKDLRKDHEFNLLLEDIIDIWNKQDGLCYYTKTPMGIEPGERRKINRTTVSIDRLDPKKGYIKENVVLCCAIVNRMKTDLQPYDFIGWVGLIYDNFIKYP